MAARKRSRPRRADLSQHFLKRDSAARLIQLTSIKSTDSVLEIGAGRGALTEKILKRTRNVVAVELDPYLVNFLETNLIGLEIVHADFLRLELPEDDYLVISNLPYGKSSEMIQRLVAASNPPLDAWLVVQAELAKRMCGLPYSRESLWSLRLKPRWHMEILDRLRKDEFSPPPSVDSVLFHLSKRSRPLLGPDEYAAYVEFIRAVFRGDGRIDKALRKHFSKRQIQRLGVDFCFRLDAHPGEIMFEQWLGVFRYWRRN